MLKKIEMDAYAAVLRAFATHASLDWNKEGILASLRKELSINADIEQEIKDEVLADLNLSRLRDAREKMGPAEPPSKKARYTAPPVRGAPPAVQTRDRSGGKSSRKKKSGSRKSEPAPVPVERPHREREPPAPAPPPQPPVLKIDEYIGRKVKRWWPDDGGWVEGVVTDYHEDTGNHVVCYEMGTDSESFEYYNIRAGNPNECKILGTTVDLAALSMLPPSAVGGARPTHGGGRMPTARAAQGAQRAGNGGAPVGPDTDLAAEVAATGVENLARLEKLKAELVSREEKIRAELDKLNAVSSSSDDDSDDSSDEE